MPCLCYEPGDYTLTGNGASILEHTSLTWFLTSDGLLGTPPDLAGQPNGNLNQMFWKLLQNDGAIVNYIHNSFSRTFGVEVGENAPAAPHSSPLLPGAPTTGVINGAVHTVVFDDFEVTYRYNLEDTEWVEVARADRAATIVQVRTRKMTIPLTAGATEIPFTIPDEDDDEDAFAFTIDDLALCYVNNDDVDSPIVGIIPGYNLSGAVLRIALSAAVPEDSTYELVVIFRRTVITNS
jgi:hypothetical protein